MKLSHPTSWLILSLLLILGCSEYTEFSGYIVGVDDQPIEGVRVDFFVVPDSHRASATSDSEGAFRVGWDGVPDGDVKLVFSCPGYEEYSKVIAKGSGEGFMEHRIVLRRLDADDVAAD